MQVNDERLKHTHPHNFAEAKTMADKLPWWERYPDLETHPEDDGMYNEKGKFRSFTTFTCEVCGKAACTGPNQAAYFLNHELGKKTCDDCLAQEKAFHSVEGLTGAFRGLEREFAKLAEQEEMDNEAADRVARYGAAIIEMQQTVKEAQCRSNSSSATRAGSQAFTS